MSRRKAHAAGWALEKIWVPDTTIFRITGKMTSDVMGMMMRTMQIFAADMIIMTMNMEMECTRMTAMRMRMMVMLTKKLLMRRK